MKPQAKSSARGAGEIQRLSEAPASRPDVPSRESVARLAHELWEASGCPCGRDVEFWLEAERRLREDSRPVPRSEALELVQT